MSGMKAGLLFPTWPDMNGEFLPSILLDLSYWNVDNFVNYDSNAFMPAMIQFSHRLVAYVLIIIGLCYFYYSFYSQKGTLFFTGIILLITMLAIQILLGILTVINCKGVIPVGYGVLHQAGALLLFSVALFLNYQFKINDH